MEKNLMKLTELVSVYSSKLDVLRELLKAYEKRSRYILFIDSMSELQMGQILYNPHLNDVNVIVDELPEGIYINAIDGGKTFDYSGEAINQPNCYIKQVLATGNQNHFMSLVNLMKKFESNRVSRPKSDTSESEDSSRPSIETIMVSMLP